ncbi:MAG: hypothetical protein AVDCRST_MAG49-222 [uncultured Thermomicrobiales bacterium]|uniref:HTH luxR-type domain-containing protein n=1 Tax=uncultured Thermomicrobiales bacterium TaxID=1645740 RepID=A0A6J4TYT9_9BACT|nr:MAG: hypothetical protein AVDCRST_MAG49-222 [uncultured Thermomicrobiales bacterium]
MTVAIVAVTPDDQFGYLPTPLTPLIGRDAELAAIEDHFAGGGRLMTLTGPGGVGKTRLALEAAARLGQTARFADGVRFVALAPVAEAALLVPTVIQALALPGVAPEAPLTQLRQALRGRQMLVVLDNFEHLIGAAPTVAQLLEACPTLAVLATSRQRLHLRGEQDLAVAPLGLPDPEQPVGLAALAASGAGRLFLERARAARGGVPLSEREAPDAAEICRRLDGLPLAIELAAARCQVLSPPALLARLADRLTLLTHGPRDLPARLRTMRDAIAWSDHLLRPEERAVFRRLAVFAGGWTLEAAEAVAGGWEGEREGGAGEGGAGDVLDSLVALVDGSLVRQRSHATGTRFSLLEIIREYAQGELAAAGETDRARRRHIVYFLGLADQAETALTGSDQGRWLDRLEVEHDNLRAALQWGTARPASGAAGADGAAGAAGADGAAEQTEMGLRLASALWRFWWLRGHLVEGRDWLERALAAAPDAPPAVRAKALDAAGRLARQGGDYARAVERHAAALALHRGLGDEAAIARALNDIGVLMDDQGHYERARASYLEAVAASRDQGDDRGVAVALSNLANMERRAGDAERAVALFAETVPRWRALGDWWGTAFALCGLGDAVLARGETSRADGLYRESLDLCRAHGNKRGLADCLRGMAEVARAEGRLPRAARLHGAAAGLRAAMGIPFPPAERDKATPVKVLLREQLGDDAFDAAWAEGWASTVDDAVAFALAETPAPSAPEEAPAAAPAAAAAPPVSGTPTPVEPSGLTRREVEVVRLLADGRSNREIAEALFISAGTVRTHVEHILAKLDLDTRAAVAAWAVRHGLV